MLTLIILFVSVVSICKFRLVAVCVVSFSLGFVSVLNLYDSDVDKALSVNWRGYLEKRIGFLVFIMNFLICRCRLAVSDAL